MAFRLKNGFGFAVLLAVLVGAALLIAYLLDSEAWAVIIPVAFPVALVVLMLFIAALPIKRKVTPEAFADELERHLLGTEGPNDWDDVTSVKISDRRLERLRLSLGARFDSLSRQEDRDELTRVIAALRRGEITVAR
ncbi:MAG: hypothetical protein ABR956_10820 [Terracidiphilus sp.]|jgi:hypothetical protein